MRRLIPIAALIALLAIPAGANAYTLGVSDQQASTFTNPALRAAEVQGRALHHALRRDGRSRQQGPARRLADRRAGRPPEDPRLLRALASQQLAGAKAPSVAAYTKELKKFKKAYPFVKDVSPWNEVNRCHALRDGSVQGQPTKICSLSTGPKLTAQYYMAARKVFTGSKYTIVGLDILDEQNVNKTIKYLKSFLSATPRRTRRSSASTTTRTPTASRPPAPSACCRPSAARCG